jgi:hypothetical protein
MHATSTMRAHPLAVAASAAIDALDRLAQYVAISRRQ